MTHREYNYLVKFQHCYKRKRRINKRGGVCRGRICFFRHYITGKLSCRIDYYMVISEDIIKKVKDSFSEIKF